MWVLLQRFQYLLETFLNRLLLLGLPIAVLAITASLTVYIWVSGDEQKELRREFRTRLDKLETRILVLKTENAAVDQAQVW